MPNPISTAASAALLLMCLFPFGPSLADEEKEKDELRQAHQDFKKGRRAYDAGEYVSGLGLMEESLATLHRHEDRGMEAAPETFTEKETEAYFMAVAFGGSLGNRSLLTKIYLRHGCYEKARALAERSLAPFERLPSSLLEKYRETNLYREPMSHLRAVAKGLGRFEEAIEIQTRILEQDRETGRGPRWIVDSVAQLASLHRLAGNPDKSKAFLEEARALYEERWREKAPSEGTRRWVERWFIAMEERPEEQRRLAEEDLASVMAQDGDNRLERIFVHSRLADIYDELGEDEKRQAAVENVSSLLLEPDLQANSSLPSVARDVAGWLREAGRAAEAERLLERYGFCSE